MESLVEGQYVRTAPTDDVRVYYFVTDNDPVGWSAHARELFSMHRFHGVSFNFEGDEVILAAHRCTLVSKEEVQKYFEAEGRDLQPENRGEEHSGVRPEGEPGDTPTGVPDSGASTGNA